MSDKWNHWKEILTDRRAQIVFGITMVLNFTPIKKYIPTDGIGIAYDELVKLLSSCVVLFSLFVKTGGAKE